MSDFNPRRILLLTVLTLILVFSAAPLVFVVIQSFSSVSFSVFPPPGLSLRWYENLFTAVAFLTAIGNSLFVALWASVLSVIAGTLAALLLTRHRLWGSGAIRFALLAPFIFPKILLGLAFFILALQLGLFGGLFSLVLAHAIITLPLAVSVMTANFALVPRVLEEAAMDLGAGPARTFFSVTLPQVRAGLAISLLLAFTVSFDEVETSLFLVRRANITIPVEMLNYMSNYQDPTVAALSTLLMGISATVVVVGLLLLRGTNVYRMLDRRSAQGEEGPQA